MNFKEFMLKTSFKKQLLVPLSIFFIIATAIPLIFVFCSFNSIVDTAIQGEIAKNLQTLVHRKMTYSIILVIVVFFAVFVTSYIYLDTVLSPLKKLSKLLHNISQGVIEDEKDLEKDVGTNEIGDLYWSYQILKKSIIEKEKIREKANDLIGKFQELNRNILETIQEVTTTTRSTFNAVEHQVETINDQVRHVTETTATMQEFMVTVQQVDSMAGEVVKLAENSLKTVEHGSKIIDQSTNTMEIINQKVTHIAQSILNLSEMSYQIGTITEMVRELSEQSKMLSFNAAIEAEKAGEYGRGFNVVSIHMKELAVQSRDATEKISDLIDKVQKLTNNAVLATEEGSKKVIEGHSLIKTLEGFFKQIADNVSNTTASSMQISVATKEQSQGVSQINTALRQISESIKVLQTATKDTEAAMFHIDLRIKDLETAVGASKAIL